MRREISMIKIGVIGTGSMGKNHVRNIADLKNIFEFVGIYDENKERAVEMANTYDIKSFNKLEDLLKSVQAVVVAVPSSLHKKIGLKIAKYGIHALIEKPLALTEKDCKSLTTAFDEKKLILAIGHIERFNPAIVELKKRLENQTIYAIEAKRCGPYDPRISDTNVILDLMIHDLDIVLNVLNKKPVLQINAIGLHAKSNNRIDYINSVIQQENGTVCSFVASRVTEGKIRTIDVHTSDEYYEADLLNKSLIVSRKVTIAEGKQNSNNVSQILETEKISLNVIEPLRTELIEFYNAINDGESRVNGVDATLAVKYANEIEKKAKSFKTILDK